MLFYLLLILVLLPWVLRLIKGKDNLTPNSNSNSKRGLLKLIKWIYFFIISLPFIFDILFLFSIIISGFPGGSFLVPGVVSIFVGIPFVVVGRWYYLRFLKKILTTSDSDLPNTIEESGKKESNYLLYVIIVVGFLLILWNSDLFGNSGAFSVSQMKLKIGHYKQMTWSPSKVDSTIGRTSGCIEVDEGVLFGYRKTHACNEFSKEELTAMHSSPRFLSEEDSVAFRQLQTKGAI